MAILKLESSIRGLGDLGFCVESWSSSTLAISNSPLFRISNLKVTKFHYWEKLNLHFTHLAIKTLAFLHSPHISFLDIPVIWCCYIYYYFLVLGNYHDAWLIGQYLLVHLSRCPTTSLFTIHKFLIFL